MSMVKYHIQHSIKPVKTEEGKKADDKPKKSKKK